MIKHDVHHFRWPTDSALAAYKAEHPELNWAIEPFSYRFAERQPADKLVVLITFGGANYHYLVGRA